MGLFDASLSTAAGIATFVATTLVAGTLLAGVVPDPVLVAIPLGIGMGAAAMTGVYVGFAAKPGSTEYRIAFAGGALGVTFCGVFLAGILTGDTVGYSLVGGLLSGVLAAIGVLAVS